MEGCGLVMWEEPSLSGLKQFLLLSCPVIAIREGGLAGLDGSYVIVRISRGSYGHFLAC
jgi:hypothetical protein